MYVPTVSITFRPRTLSPTEIPNPPNKSIQIGVEDVAGMLPVEKTTQRATRGPIALLKA